MELKYMAVDGTIHDTEQKCLKYEEDMKKNFGMYHSCGRTDNPNYASIIHIKNNEGLTQFLDYCCYKGYSDFGIDDVGLWIWSDECDQFNFVDRGTTETLIQFFKGVWD